MKGPSCLTLLVALGSVSAACYENRPLILAGNDGGANATTGAAGTGDTSGGQAGGSGTTARGCDVTPLVTKYSCTLAGACHDRAQAATKLDMTSVGWEQKLVGTFPADGSAFPSMCLGSTEPYLVAGTSPARGLFLDKLEPNPPCGIQMPSLPPRMSAEDLDCFQRWANALTTP